MAECRRNYCEILINKTTGTWLVPDQYTKLEPIGSGAYGQVCSAYDNVRQMKVAIKRLTRPLQTGIHAKRAYREIRTLKHMHHENVLGLFDIFAPDDGTDNFNVYLVTHLMGSDLSQILRTQRLSDDHIKFFVYQLLRGVKYIHSAGIIHRDLKPGNIAVNEECELKILDFGLARPTITDSSMTGYVVTRWYRAPEVMLNWMHYTKTVDVWAIGCMMAEMITGRTLFPGKDHIDQLRKTLELTGTPSPQLLEKLTSDEARKFLTSLPHQEKKDFKKFFAGANPDAIDLLERMLDLDPDTRITVEQALAHEYMKSYADASDEPESEPYDKRFDDKDVDVSEWKKLILEEVDSFVPPPIVVDQPPETMEH